ncbi:hypothetical protein CHLRE_14g633900v5 [Chlamydomonas reinhardtii]|uniref:FAD/NAD(P)-binding domain-containing protein n=1 Tax=Chlamydomonas reinhardtii TaxID=3055 RepID=A0A2K3CYZ1_CHLRE|nr:uncharacterized protein CHLRE_14g633900v5 [Chlamydomonas reinhardtii]PNW73492.1 hypothetical protein CHLRE_14g633900v5 [Chlamydomonas reinhardtii]
MKTTVNPKELVLLGGGHSHVEVLRAWGQHRLAGATSPAPGAAQAAPSHAPPMPATAPSPPPPPPPSASAARVTLISRGRWTPYSGMLPGWAAGFYSFEEVHIDLQRLAAYAGARLVLGEATGLDLEGRRVLLAPPPAQAPPQPTGQPAQAGADGGAGGGAAPNQLGAQAQAQAPGASGRWGGAVSWSVLSINTGITPGVRGVPGAQEHATPVKPIDGFVRRFEGLLQRYRDAAAKTSPQPSAGRHEGDQHQGQGQGQGRPVVRVVVVGGGAGGVELAAAVRYRLEEERLRGGWPKECAAAKVSLVCRGGLLPGHPPHVRRLVARLLQARLGVEVRQRAEVTRASPGRLHLRLLGGSGGGGGGGGTGGGGGGKEVQEVQEVQEVLTADEVLWCTQAAPPEWVAASGLPTDGRGFLALNDCLQAEGGPPEVFGAGDVATVTRHPRPKAGVFAVRQGPPLARNLAAHLAGRPLEPFTPQSTALALITLGGRFCVASRTGGVAAKRPAGAGAGAGSRPAAGSGRPEDEDDGPEWPLGWLLNGCGGLAVDLTGPLLWRWKDGIDRAFMRRYGEGLPPGDWERGGGAGGGFETGKRHTE